MIAEMESYEEMDGFLAANHRVKSMLLLLLLLLLLVVCFIAHETPPALSAEASTMDASMK